MDKEQLDRLNEKLNVLLKEFNGNVTHRTRGAFITKWKEVLKQEGLRGDTWLHELLKRRGL